MSSDLVHYTMPNTAPENAYTTPTIFPEAQGSCSTSPASPRPNPYAITIPPYIQPFPHLTPEQRVVKLTQHRNPKEIKKTTDKYIVFKKDKEGRDYAGWKTSGIPTPREVKQMLDAYHTRGLCPFRKVKSVLLLGRGLTNLYFLVRFHPARTHEEERCPLPAKVVLRFLLPVFASVDPKNKHDSKLQSKLEYEIAVTAHVGKYTDLIPKVLVFDPWGQNELQLEWVMTEFRDGFVLQKCGDPLKCTCETGLDGFQPLGGRPPVLSGAQEDKIRRQVREIFNRVEEGFMSSANLGPIIGGLGINWETNELRKSELTLEQFHINERKYGVKRLQLSRGPFDSVEAYIDESMKVAYPDLDEGALYTRKMTLLSTLEVEGLGLQEVLNFMRRFDFPAEEDEWPVTINHTNLHEGNILVDGSGELVAIMGWEDAIVFPTAWRGLLQRLDLAFKQLSDDNLFRPLSDLLRPFQRGNPFGPARRSHGTGHVCPRTEIGSPVSFRADEPRSAESNKKEKGRAGRVVRRLAHFKK
ncbi:hypothetical protein CkaCkLH20_05220 [Colletotrichum karsti]|uniref:Aminoglycoside phosphotransferase domain-containing protein n=1 Tax=Colletotrichum karsti TaxID=1095194 RepID=A0A9P6I7Y0_9PEZI|nr:uncharacterized protein CkaCkLH20_05220 [Colletotrichum karsti]KAF9877520.1 hypothetical protein CkaCkLH20_05220 [Colletotrichum karsti]